MEQTARAIDGEVERIGVSRRTAQNRQVAARDGDQSPDRKPGEIIAWRGSTPLTGLEPAINLPSALTGTALGRQSPQPTSGPSRLGTSAVRGNG